MIEIIRLNVCDPDQGKIMNEPVYTKKDLWHEDFYDLLKVLEMGAKKHGARNWESGNNGSKSSFKEMHDSMFHHLAESFAADVSDKINGKYYESNRYDQESELDPLLHLACRALMCYSLIKRGKYNES